MSVTKDLAVQLAKQFAVLVRNEFDNNAKVYMFGSAARDEMDDDSDIDIAVVSEVFTDDVVSNRVVLMGLAQTISWDIEPHPIIAEYMIKTTPFTEEIKSDGILL